MAFAAEANQETSRSTLTDFVKTPPFDDISVPLRLLTCRCVFRVEGFCADVKSCVARATESIGAVRTALVPLPAPRATGPTLRRHYACANQMEVKKSRLSVAWSDLACMAAPHPLCASHLGPPLFLWKFFAELSVSYFEPSIFVEYNKWEPFNRQQVAILLVDPTRALLLRE